MTDLVANYRFPYDKSEAVPFWLCAVLVIIFPIVVILLVTLIFVPGATVPRHTPGALIWKRKMWEFHISFMGFALAHIIAFFFTQGMKNLFGKPRPDLLGRCQPDLDNASDYVVGGYAGESMMGQLFSASICQQTDKSVLDDGFRSYPSGHSSSSAAGLIYLSLFLASKFAVVIPFVLPSAGSQALTHTAFPSRMARSDSVRDESSEFSGPTSSKPVNGYQASHNAKIQSLRNQAAAPPLYLLACVLAPFALSIYISASRWFDYRHHGFDILFGYLMGFIPAVYAFRYYHLPIQQGAGWAWGPRSHDRAFWAGVGRLGYSSLSPVEDSPLSSSKDAATSRQIRSNDVDAERGEAFGGQRRMTQRQAANGSEYDAQEYSTPSAYPTHAYSTNAYSSEAYSGARGQDHFSDVEMQRMDNRF